MHLTLLCFAALQVPLGVLLTLHFMPRALLEELRERASGVTKTDYKVRVCVLWGALLRPSPGVSRWPRAAVE